MITERQKQALRYFAAGYNCAQSVFQAYGDLAGLTQAQSALISAGFGGGVGRLRLQCGAFSAAVMLCGLMAGPEGGRPEMRPAVYRRVQEVHRQFLAACGAVSCAELLHIAPGAQEPTPEKRTPAYYAKRPCSRVILAACRIIEAQLDAKENE